MIEKAINEFEKYTSNYDKTVREINLKYYHSYKVMELMGILAEKLNLCEEEIEIAKLIGLLHDIGRFEQFRKYHTLNDSASSDHADESCVYLFDEGHIRDFIDDDKYDNVIYSAIKNHNKKEISKDVKEDKELLFSRMIRDTDKIDIYIVYATYYNYYFDAEEVSSEVLSAFKEEKIIDLSIRKSKGDAMLVILAFIFDINFNESYDLLVETDNFDLFLGTVDVYKNSEKLWKKLREVCFDKINRGV